MKHGTFFLILLAIGLAGCSGTSREKPIDSTPPIVISVVKAGSEAWPLLYESTGTVRARTSSVISSQLMGYVRDVKVTTGDHVRAGQTLVTLDTRDLDANARRAEAAREEVRTSLPVADSAVGVAKADLDLAQATFSRMKELFQKTSISNQEFDEASAKLKAAQAGFEMARARRTQVDSKLAQTEQEVRGAEITRGYGQVSAPFAGVVTAKTVEPGTLAMQGTPLLTIEREGAFRLEAGIEESRLAAIKVGQPVSVILDGVNHAVDARVSEIVPVVDAASRSYVVKVDLPTLPAIRSGVFGRVTFRLGSRPVLAIPIGAVSERGQLQYVMVAENGTAHTRLITEGQKANDRTEVLSGLSAGEKIIFPVPQGLADGARVEVRR